jgi:hypothetical protein
VYTTSHTAKDHAWSAAVTHLTTDHGGIYHWCDKEHIHNRTALDMLRDSQKHDRTDTTKTLSWLIPSNDAKYSICFKNRFVGGAISSTNKGKARELLRFADAGTTS